MWPPSEPSSKARMPLRCVTISIDSGLTGWRRENASRCRVKPGPRDSVGALEYLEAAGEHGQKIIEVVRHAAGELSERFHLLRLTKRRLGMVQTFLVAQPFGDVVDKLISADLAAIACAQGAVMHLVGAPVA